MNNWHMPPEQYEDGSPYHWKILESEEKLKDLKLGILSGPTDTKTPVFVSTV